VKKFHVAFGFLLLKHTFKFTISLYPDVGHFRNIISSNGTNKSLDLSHVDLKMNF